MCRGGELFLEALDGFLESGFDFHAVFDCVAGVDDCAVVAASKDLADFFEGEVGEVSAEEHGDLPGDGNFAGAPGAGKVHDF